MHSWLNIRYASRLYMRGVVISITTLYYHIVIYLLSFVLIQAALLGCYSKAIGSSKSAIPFNQLVCRALVVFHGRYIVAYMVESV